MKGALRVAAAAVVLCATGFDSAGALFFRNTEDAVGAQEKIASFAVEDFVLPLGGPDPDNTVNGVQLRIALFQTLPVLEGQGLSMGVLNVEACAVNPPHIHPRAAEIIYMLEGDLRVGFTEESGGTGAIINDISQGDVTLFPQGLVHYQQNLGCSQATFVAALNSEDPGTSFITTNLFNLPIEAIKAVLPVDDTDLEAIITALPTVLTTSRQECLEECGLTPGGDGVCSNGLPGVQFEDACCSLSCGTCGGLGCGQRDGGRDECCTGTIRDNGLLCSESESSPCIVDDE
ncbi:unnamed protein product [Ascophyllum nodosum]